MTPKSQISSATKIGGRFWDSSAGTSHSLHWNHPRSQLLSTPWLCWASRLDLRITDIQIRSDTQIHIDTLMNFIQVTRLHIFHHWFVDPIYVYIYSLMRSVRINQNPLEAEALQAVDSSSWSLRMCVTKSNGDQQKNINHMFISDSTVAFFVVLLENPICNGRLWFSNWHYNIIQPSGVRKTTVWFLFVCPKKRCDHLRWVINFPIDLQRWNFPFSQSEFLPPNGVCAVFCGWLRGAERWSLWTSKSF